jgi:3-methyl-2-oxobutanoate hydroxymethyltransferase
MTESVLYGGGSTARVRVHHLQQAKARGEKWAMLTAYDTYAGAVFEEAGIPVLLVGDSAGNVVLGHTSTVPVTVEDLLLMTKAVTRSTRRALIVADLPFGSYQNSPESAFSNAVRLMAAGAQMVKLEGGGVMAQTVRFLVERGIPVCGHVGLIPQSVHQLGGYRVQRDADRLLEDARAVEQAGAAMLVLEAIPAAIGKQVTEALSIPTIGIGAGKDCSGQVLVLHDMLDIYPGRKARFVRNFMAGAPGIAEAIRRYVEAVKSGAFPAPEHTF